MPSVSVVVPTRDRPALLARALASVASQTAAPLEVIVVDDGSRRKADALAVAEKLLDITLRFVRLTPSRGAAAARNEGIRAARGEWVAFLDDDDTWEPHKLMLQGRALASAPPEVAAVYCGYNTVLPSGRVLGTWAPPAREFRFEDFLRTTGFGASVPLIRACCLAAVGGFDPMLPASHDRDLWIRLSQHHAFRAIPDVLVTRTLHGNQLTSDLATKLIAKEALLAKHHAALRRHPVILAKQLRRLGYLHCAGGSLQRGRDCLRESLRHDPTSNEARRHLALSFRDAERLREVLLRDVFPSHEGVSLFY